MAPDDEWIRDEVTDPAGSRFPDAAPAEDEGWPDEGRPDGGWPPGPGGSAGAGVPRPPAGSGKPWSHGGAPGFSGWIAAVVAVAAAVAGIAVGLYLVRATPTASAASGATPSASAPTLRAPSVLPGLSGNGNGQLQMMLTGQVVAVSRTSITIGGAGPAVTAAVTSATKIAGSVHGIGGVKVGDEISAQISGTPSHLTATALQDPAGNSGTS
jgi:hypothetical protein